MTCYPKKKQDGYAFHEVELKPKDFLVRFFAAPLKKVGPRLEPRHIFAPMRLEFRTNTHPQKTVKTPSSTADRQEAAYRGHPRQHSCMFYVSA